MAPAFQPPVPDAFDYPPLTTVAVTLKTVYVDDTRVALSQFGRQMSRTRSNRFVRRVIGANARVVAVGSQEHVTLFMDYMKELCSRRFFHTMFVEVAPSPGGPERATGSL